MFIQLTSLGKSTHIHPCLLEHCTKHICNLSNLKKKIKELETVVMREILMPFYSRSLFFFYYCYLQ